MKILMASSEVHPFSKSGGLADMVTALAKALGRAGHEVAVITPLYAGIRARHPQLEPFDYFIDLPLGHERRQAGVWVARPNDGVTVYFVDQGAFFDRPGLYHENHVEYSDNAQRFIFFSKCVVHLARYLPFQPDLIHVHDWQVGLVPIFVLHQKWKEGWVQAPRTSLSVHNLGYQGNFPRAAYNFTNLPLDYFNPNGVEFFGQMSCLKAGLCYSDLITTVSPRYAREIMTPNFGCGLDAVLRQRREALVGILNGVDYEEWNTTDNPHLRHPYNLKKLEGKTLEKLDLQKELGLPVDAALPLFASITRLVDQKGVDIQLGALEEMLAAGLQFVLLGTGSSYYEKSYRSLATRFPDRVAARIGFDQWLSHRIEAAADFFLMPSRYEPCGLNQMYSLRYGTIPIVRRTGGLDDSVVDISDDPVKADGIKFQEHSVRALAKAIRKAMVLHQHPDLLEHYRRNAMRADFSWDQTCGRYVEEYKRLLGRSN